MPQKGVNLSESKKRTIARMFNSWGPMLGVHSDTCMRAVSGGSRREARGVRPHLLFLDQTKAQFQRAEKKFLRAGTPLISGWMTSPPLGSYSYLNEKITYQYSTDICT